MQGRELMSEGSLGQDSLEDLLITCSERSEDVFTLEKGPGTTLHKGASDVFFFFSGTFPHDLR